MNPEIIIIRPIISINHHHHLILLLLLLAAVIDLFANCETNACPSWEPAVRMGYSLGESEDRVVGRIAVEG
jgi:hypothetical protein